MLIPPPPPFEQTFPSLQPGASTLQRLGSQKRAEDGPALPPLPPLPAAPLAPEFPWMKEKKSAKKTAVIVWIAIISIFSLPISLPIALCLLLVILALFVSLLILFISLIGAGIAVMAAGASVFLVGLIAPGIGQKLVCFGGGMLVTAIGMALCFLTVIVYILLIRLAVQIIKKSAEKKVKKA